jgi:uncharacterized repeat protein (TIGR02543 family)
MTKKYLIVLALLAVTLTLLLSGCGKSEQDLDGMYVASFELNGGTLDLKSFNVSTKINYAYEPGSYILDPTTYGNYEIFREGYIFTGWYRTAECNENEKWNFSTDTINSEGLTLYAGWEKKIVYSYTVCYLDGTETKTLGTYSVEAGAAFEDYRKYANKREDFTPSGYFADAACTTPWDFATVHPGGEVDTDIAIYVDGALKGVIKSGLSNAQRYVMDTLEVSINGTKNITLDDVKFYDTELVVPTVPAA